MTDHPQEVFAMRLYEERQAAIVRHRELREAKAMREILTGWMEGGGLSAEVNNNLRAVYDEIVQREEGLAR